MADGYIDLSGVYSAINSATREISREIDGVKYDVDAVRQDVENVRRQTMEEIYKVKVQLEVMEKNARFRAALQKAVTEIIRVRQELESKFSTQKKVREYMLGILDASDLALIQKTTIGNCTEELMLGAPKYWLAPALIAIAAWIADNKPLADRALKEALRRDDEKVSLLMALITRRVNAGRIQNGKTPNDPNIQFKWLNRYFGHQDPLKMRTSILAFVDAYSNGVFGYDRDKICEDQINSWMRTLMEKVPNFEDQQREYWKGVFASRTIKYDTDNYRALKLVCNNEQFRSIDDYLDRICTAEDPNNGIKAQFTNMMNSPVDAAKLIEDIDVQLHDLVSKYEEDEAELRNEERLLTRIKELNGDEDVAKAQIEAEDAKIRARDVPVNFAERLGAAINDETRPNSEKITAIRLLRPYISAAFNEFVVAPKESYPQLIDLTINEPGKVFAGKAFTWTAQTENGENKDELLASLGKKYDETRDMVVASITDDDVAKAKKNATVCFCLFFLALIPVFIGIYFRSKAKKLQALNDSHRAQAKAYYDRNKAASVSMLSKALDGRVEANSIVANFLEDPETNESIVL